MNPPLLNPIQFIESPAGLSFQESISGLGLYPVQKFVLKMLFGLPLSEDPEAIKIPVSWEKAGSDKKWDRFSLSEKDYLEYLKDQNRAFVPEEGGRPLAASLAFGRRSGTSTLLEFAALYDIFCLIEDPDLWEKTGQPMGSLHSVMLYSFTVDSSRIRSNSIKRLIKDCYLLKDSNSRSTRSSYYFTRPYNESKPEAVRLLIKPYRVNHIKGTSAQSIYVDCASEIDKDFIKANYPTLVPPDGTLVLAATPSKKRDTFCEEYWKNAEDTKGLSLSIPSWELNPTIPATYFKEVYDRDPDSFEHEMKAKVPELDG